MMRAPKEWFAFLIRQSNDSLPHRTAFFATLWTMWEYKKDDADRARIELGVLNKLKGYHKDGWAEAVIWNQRLFGKNAFEEEEAKELDEEDCDLLT